MLLPQGAGALLTRTAAGRLTDVYGGRVVATGQTVSLAATESADDFSMSFLVLVAVSAAGAVASLIFPRSK